MSDENHISFSRDVAVYKLIDEKEKSLLDGSSDLSIILGFWLRFSMPWRLIFA